jgi:hypothetical protein
MQQQMRWLIAWMNEPEALSSLLGHVPGPDENINEVRALWQAAKMALQMRAPYQQPAPVLLDLPLELHEEIAEFQKSPDVAAVLHGLDWQIGFVDLNNVLSFQKAVAEEDAVGRANDTEIGDLKNLFSFCLPTLKNSVALAGSLDHDQKAITFSSLNPNLRIGSHVLLDIEVAPGPGLPTKTEKLVGFVVSFGSRFIQVVEYNGRWFLRDGYHRCFGLLSRGIHKIPCIFIKAKSFEETGAASAGFFPYEILFGERPPLLTDFLNDNLSRTASRLAQRKVLRISAEEFVVQV